MQVQHAVCNLPKELTKHFTVNIGVSKNHSKTEHCKHDIDIVGIFYTCLNQYGLIKPGNASLLTMMYHLCLVEDAVTDLEIGQTDEAGAAACTACEFAASLESVLFEKVRRILHNRPGHTLRDALSEEERLPRPRYPERWPDKEEEEFGGCAEQIAMLFENLLGTTFRGTGTMDSFET